MWQRATDQSLNAGQLHRDETLFFFVHGATFNSLSYLTPRLCILETLSWKAHFIQNESFSDNYLGKITCIQINAVLFSDVINFSFISKPRVHSKIIPILQTTTG